MENNFKYLLIVHAVEGKNALGGDVSIPLRGETLDEARAYALKMLRGERAWWHGRLRMRYDHELEFTCSMDPDENAYTDLDKLFEETEFYGGTPGVPLLNEGYPVGIILGASIVEFVEEISLIPLMQEFTDWKYDKEKRLYEERERAEYERLKAKFE